MKYYLNTNIIIYFIKGQNKEILEWVKYNSIILLKRGQKQKWPLFSFGRINIYYVIFKNCSKIVKMVVGANHPS